MQRKESHDMKPQQGRQHRRTEEAEDTHRRRRKRPVETKSGQSRESAGRRWGNTGEKPGELGSRRGKGKHKK